MTRFRLSRWVEPARLGRSLRVRRAIDSISVSWLSPARIGEVSGLPEREVDHLLGRLAHMGALEARADGAQEPAARARRRPAQPLPCATPDALAVDPVPGIAAACRRAPDEAGEATTLMLGLR